MAKKKADAVDAAPSDGAPVDEESGTSATPTPHLNTRPYSEAMSDERRAELAAREARGAL